MPQPSSKRRLLAVPRFQKPTTDDDGRGVERTPLLPFRADPEGVSVIIEPRTTVESFNTSHTTTTSTTTYSIDGYPTNNIMSSAVSPGGSTNNNNNNNNGSRNTRKGASILGASKKVVSSAMRRPLKSLGRAVTRKDSSMSRSRQEDEDALMISSRHMDPVVINLDSANGYGTMSETPHDPDYGMALSSSHRSIVHSESRAIDWPVHSMEQFTRLLLLLCAAYTVGAQHPQWTTEVARIAEYILTAWITCGLILMLGYFQRNCPQWVPGFRGAVVLQQQSTLQPIARETLVSARPLPLATAQKVSPVPPSTSPLRDVSEPSEVIEFENLAPIGPVPPEIPLSHPALSRLYVVDTATNERIYCNTEQPTHVSTEWFEMDTMILIRTPDVDDPKAEKGTPGNAKWSDYMRGKQRRFEFQYQIKLKKVPVGKDVYFSCEVEEPIKMGIIQRAFVGAAMAFMKSTNPTFHYSITGSKERSTDGKYERPHMSFTVEGSLDRLVISKPGEKVPELGTVIHEDPESMKRRKKGGLVDWNLEDTYTMALWSSYVDFLDWRVINLPGIRPFGLSSVLGSQAFYLTMYMIDKDRNSDKHFQKDLEYVVNWELGNDREAEKGPHASQWAKANQRTRLKPRRLDSGDGILSVDIEGEITASRSADEFLIEEIEDDDDAETAAELGEGIYMRSGDRVCLREFLRGSDDEGKSSFVANGGGFAIFQDQDVEVIIEKTRRSMKNRLIKSGDTVMFKMVPRNKELGTRYLTIHRGWWLKWVSSVPSKNGFFTISTHDGSMEIPDICGQTADSQAVYLTMGGPFTLRHKRWSSYFVGVAGEPSPTYGGRMLGLYNPSTTQQIDEQYQSDEGEYEDGEPDLKATKPTWMRPLVLSAIEAQFSPVEPTSPRKLPELAYSDFEAIADASKIRNDRRMTFCHEQAHADVPAWIEMMNRRDRVRQLAYVVRVGIRPKDDQRSDDSGPEELDVGERDTESFFRLRTGRELAQIMSVGQRVTDFVQPDDSPRHRARVGGVDSGFPMSPKTTPPRNQFLDVGSPVAVAAKKEVGSDCDKNYDSVDAELDAEASDDDESVEYPTEIENIDSGDCLIQGDEIDEEGEEIGLETDTDESEGEGNVATDAVKHKRRGMMDKSKALLGKSVKATVGAAKLGVKTTKLTGKAALGTAKFSAKAVKGAGKFTGKAAVGTTKVAFRSGKKAVSVGRSAGRAVMAPVSRKSKNPPKTEPKTKYKEKDHVSVSRSLRKMARREKKKSHAFVAGELCAPEQTRRTASRMLSRMSSLPMNAAYWKECNGALKSQVQHETDQDRWFLEGTSVELGVTPLAGENSRGRIIHGCVVARCLWESHWREEWSGVYESCLSFYTPLSKSPCLEIAYIDITSVRPLATGLMSPLPGLPLLVLETAWLCHYIAFHDEVSRDTFGEKVEAAIESHMKQIEATASVQQEDLRKARFWQGFQSLSESSLSSSTGKWAKVSSKDKLKSRAILNGRRMAFDSLDFGDVDMSNKFAFVEDLLSRALSFSLESLENKPESFIEFLDLTSQLKILALDEIDPTNKSSLCLFANVYHCLLQQAMLLSVNGPLHKRSVNHFMRTACYEIGDDVFSLAELYCNVLRGKMSKPVNPKPPYIEAPKKSVSYRHYALECRDPRINFVLNTGDVASPRSIPILQPRIVEDQLNEAAAMFLRKELMIDSKRGLIVLPKICEVYKNDFGGDAPSCLKFCMGGLEEGAASTIRLMMMDASSLAIRHSPSSEQYHTSLTLRTEQIHEAVGYEV